MDRREFVVMKLLVVLILTLTLVDGCKKISKSFLDCKNETLSSVPSNPHGLAIKSLDLSRNKLKTIQDDDFREFRSLQVLFLDHNYIARVDKNVFINLPDLKQVNLGKNRITSLSSHTFEFHDHLRMLTLTMNRISKLLAQDTPLLYSKSLTILELGFCKLKSIHANSFQGLLQLEHLDLRNNSLTTLPPDVFRGLDRLQRVYLTGNGWRCDHRFIQSMRNVQRVVQDFQALTCVDDEGNTRHVQQLVEDYTPIEETNSSRRVSHRSSFEILIDAMTSEKNATEQSEVADPLAQFIADYFYLIFTIDVILYVWVFAIVSYITIKYMAVPLVRRGYEKYWACRN